MYICYCNCNFVSLQVKKLDIAPIKRKLLSTDSTKVTLKVIMILKTAIFCVVVLHTVVIYGGVIGNVGMRSLKTFDIKHSQLSSGVPNHKTTERSERSFPHVTEHNSSKCEIIHRKDKKCPMHFPCDNGHCKEIIRDSNVLSLKPIREIYCQCDPGWTGDTCGICCSLPCVNKGTCLIDPLVDTPFCGCQWGFSGHLCEKVVKIITPLHNNTERIVGQVTTRGR